MKGEQGEAPFEGWTLVRQTLFSQLIFRSFLVLLKPYRKEMRMRIEFFKTFTPEWELQLFLHLDMNETCLCVIYSSLIFKWSFILREVLFRKSNFRLPYPWHFRHNLPGYPFLFRCSLIVGNMPFPYEWHERNRSFLD